MLSFAQLNPETCSLALSHYWILYDLYVDKHERRTGFATRLLAHVRSFAIESGASRVDLQTAYTNQPAQRLYEKNGYVRETAFHAYSLDLSACVPELSADKEKGSAAKLEKLKPRNPISLTMQVSPATSSHAMFAAVPAANTETVTSADLLNPHVQRYSPSIGED